MVTLARSIQNALLLLADAAECVQPFSKEARQIDAAVKMLERIDTQTEP